MENTTNNDEETRIPTASDFFAFLKNYTERSGSTPGGKREHHTRNPPPIRGKAPKQRLVRSKLQLQETPDEWCAAQEKYMDATCNVCGKRRAVSRMTASCELMQCSPRKLTSIGGLNCLTQGGHKIPRKDVPVSSHIFSLTDDSPHMSLHVKKKGVERGHGILLVIMFICPIFVYVSPYSQTDSTYLRLLTGTNQPRLTNIHCGRCNL